MIQREIRCCEYGEVFTAVGRGNEVDCPFCGVTLMIPDERRNMDDEQHRNRETDYYDEDMKTMEQREQMTMA